jgi:hypothetical protein
MFHYIDHKDRQGQPRTACGLNAHHVWTPTFWERGAFLDYKGNPGNGTGPADRCPHCAKVAKGTKHNQRRTFDEYAGLWAAKVYDFGQEREVWHRLTSRLSIAMKAAHHSI